MLKTRNITVGLVLSTILLVGCASKGFVLEEVNKAKSIITKEQGKKLDDSVTQVSSELTKRIMTLETEYVSKNHLQSELYTYEQKLMKVIDEQIAEIKTAMEELNSWKSEFKFANKEDITQLSHDLVSVMDALFRKLNAEKEGLERAMGEIEKLSLPTTAPETTPEDN